LNFQDDGGDDLDMGKSDAREAIHPTLDKTPVDEEKEVQDARPMGNLRGATISEVDLKLLEVNGDYIHQNYGTHLDGGIQDDGVWQEQWQKLITLPSQRYDAPSGAVGRHFVNILALELEGICHRKWNSERFNVFQMVVLQRLKEVKTALAIRQRITKRLDSGKQLSLTCLYIIQSGPPWPNWLKFRVWRCRNKELRRLLGLSSKASLGRWFGGREIKKRGECYSWSKQMKRQETLSLTYSGQSIRILKFQMPPNWRSMKQYPTLLIWM
jgi:hypothetical protein